jgi:hypothetical protein
VQAVSALASTLAAQGKAALVELPAPATSVVDVVVPYYLMLVRSVADSDIVCMSAPSATSAFIASTCPLNAAQCSGVAP